MSYVVSAKDNLVHNKIPAVVHSDGTSRVQIVKKLTINYIDYLKFLIKFLVFCFIKYFTKCK